MKTNVEAVKQKRAQYNLARLRVGYDADLDAIKDIYPDAPVDTRDTIVEWLIQNTEVLVKVAELSPDGPPPEDEKQRLWPLADLLADETPTPEDVVEGFLPGLSVILFSGPGGDGKSYAMLDLAMCVSRGIPWLGMDTEQTPVLIVDLENRFIRMRNRARSAMQGHTLTIPPAVTLAFSLDARLDEDETVQEITNLAEQCGGAKLVILDSLCDFWGELDENSNSDMAKAAERLRAIAETIGGSVIGIHHTPKANAQTPRGATALRNGTDVNIIVSRDGNILRMKQDKNRSGPEMNVTAQMNWGSGTFNLSAIGTSVGREKPPPDPDEAAILAMLEDGEWHWSNEVIKEVMGVTARARGTVHRKLSAMINDQVFEKDDQGVGKPYLVRIVPVEKA